jgi:hypothetical protein
MEMKKAKNEEREKPNQKPSKQMDQNNDSTRT